VGVTRFDTVYIELPKDSTEKQNKACVYLLERRATPRRRRKPAHMHREAHLQHGFLLRRTRLIDGKKIEFGLPRHHQSRRFNRNDQSEGRGRPIG
jgi:hypothetical protein